MSAHLGSVSLKASPGTGASKSIHGQAGEIADGGPAVEQRMFLVGDDAGGRVEEGLASQEYGSGHSPVHHFRDYWSA